MASVFQAPLVGRVLGSSAYQVINTNPAIVPLINDIVFPKKTVYVGPSTRTTRYTGVKTDAEVYLGRNRLFG